jgi:hypothetical protein
MEISLNILLIKNELINSFFHLKEMIYYQLIKILINFIL